MVILEIKLIPVVKFVFSILKIRLQNDVILKSVCVSFFAKINLMAGTHLTNTVESPKGQALCFVDIDLTTSAVYPHLGIKNLSELV